MSNFQRNGENEAVTNFAERTRSNAYFSFSNIEAFNSA